MSLLIMNYNHWIGYHLVTTLLDEDCPVDGMVDKEKCDLSMFFGRNSLFSFVEKDQLKLYDTCFVIGENQYKDTTLAKRTFIINPKAPVESNDGEVIEIQSPLLFGEWMPMDENGIYRDKEYISFQSERFKTEAIYIKHFIDGLLQLMKITDLPKTVTLYSKNHRTREERFGNIIYIRANDNLDKVKDLITHYKKFGTKS